MLAHYLQRACLTPLSRERFLKAVQESRSCYSRDSISRENLIVKDVEGSFDSQHTQSKLDELNFATVSKSSNSDKVCVVLLPSKSIH